MYQWIAVWYLSNWIYCWNILREFSENPVSMPTRLGPKSGWDTQHAWKSTTNEPNWTTFKTTIKGHFHEIYDMLMKCMKRIEVYWAQWVKKTWPRISQAGSEFSREISGIYPGNDHIYRRSPPENSNDRGGTTITNWCWKIIIKVV